MEENTKKAHSAMRSILRDFIKFVFSTFGTVALVALYAVAGGYLFQYLEQANEKDECFQQMDSYSPMENDTIRLMLEIGASFRDNKAHSSEAVATFRLALASFRDEILFIGYDGSDCSAMGEPDGPPYGWSFAGSLLFSCTVITTIGYGNIAPKTTWGRISCIGYALLGIPIMLICLSNIGEVLAQVFRLAYHEVICFGCFRRSLKHDKNLQTGRARVAAFGENGISDGEVETNSAVEGEDDANSSDDDDFGKSVPLTVTLCQLAWYIFFGALMFGVWEDWDWMKAAYFCFITMSTVGFGDVVPGTSNLSTSEGQQKMVGVAVYMLLGMALMSMVFALIQEEMVGKFQWIADLLRPAGDRFESRPTATETKDSLEGKIGQNEPCYELRMFDTFTTQYTPAGHSTGHDDQAKNRPDKRQCRKNVKVHPFIHDEYFEEVDEL